MGITAINLSLLATVMPRAASSSSTKALQAILPLVEAGQPYEAHQKARTFASRYVKSQQYDTAIDVLFQSARELLKVGQLGSGTDLASFLLDVYDTKGETVNDESRGEHSSPLHLLISIIRPLTLCRYCDLRTTDSTHRAHWDRGNMAEDDH